MPQQLLSQTIDNDIYAADGVADEDINDITQEYNRNVALSNLSKRRKNWNLNFINPDEAAMTKLLNVIIDPSENKHDLESVEKINKEITKLFQINENNKFALDV